MTTDTQRVLHITDQAVAKILEIRDQEAGEDEFALRIEITGIQGNSFAYELAFEPVEDLTPDDIVHRYGDLPVAVAASTSRDLRGATLDLSGDLLEGGLVLDNPNTPSPSITDPSAPPPDLSGPTAQKVHQLLEEQINPAIAMHGGGAELVSTEEDTVYLRLHGGCQGCGMAQVTLKQGIEQAIFGAIPEVRKVVDVTDHGAGTDPYYSPSK